MGHFQTTMKTMATLPISVCYIVKDEAAFLEASLASVVPFASEIIVVDTGSSDQTVEIARRFTSQVLFFEWKDDFSKARNFAASLAQEPWILFVDGDEIVDDSAADEICSLIKNESVHAYSVMQRNYSEPRNIIGWVSSSVPQSINRWVEGMNFTGYVDNMMYKLYRNHCGIEWSGVIHETIIHSCRSKNLNWRESLVVFHHLAEAKKPELKFRKKKYYLELALQKLKNDSLHENPWFELAICFCNLEMWNEGEKALAEALKIRPDWHEARLMRAQVLLQLEHFQMAEVELRALLETSFHFEDVLAHLSTALLYQAKFDECLKIISAGEAIGLKHPHFHINAATLLFELKDFQRCREHLVQAREIVPQDLFVQESLVKVGDILSAASA